MSEQEKAWIFEDENSQDFRESFNSSVEREVKYRNLDLLKSDFLSPFMVSVLKSELYVMLSSHQNHHPSHFLKQPSAEIITAIHNRMVGRGYSFIRKDLIKSFLNRLYHIFKAKLARGEDINALVFWLQEEQEETERLERLRQMQGTKKSKGGRPRKRVQGHKRPIMGFPSIAEAARQTGESYSYLQRKSLDENSV